MDGQPTDDPPDASEVVELQRLLIEGVDDYAIFVLDRSRRVLSWNRGAIRLFGYQPAEILGTPADRIFTPEDVEAGVPEGEAWQAFHQGRAADNRWHRRKDGTRFWANGLMVRLDGPGGEVRGLAKILRDETPLKLAEDQRDQAATALRASEQKFRRLIEANIVGVGIASASGAWVDANDALLALLGKSRAQLRAGYVRWDRMTPDEDRDRDRLAIAEADRLGACAPYEKDYIREDGTRVPVLLGFASVSGVQGYYICFVLDLTPQKRVELALRDADRRKDEFLAMLAHELRNPLSAIGNAIQVIRRSPDDTALDWAKTIIDKHVRSLSRMIDDLLDVSRITRGKIELQTRPVELAPILSHAVETVRPLMEHRRHSLELRQSLTPIWVEADPHRLEQVVVNLLNNAAKYTDPGGQITIASAKEGQDTVAIQVVDDGTGIPPERIPEMFELFAQGDRSIARSEGGLGIGLTLVRNIVELHGGSVVAHSDGKGQGSTFTVRLPSAQAPMHPTTPPHARPEPKRTDKRGRVLVVDDNVDTLRGMAMLLKLAGYEVTVASDGLTALEAVHRIRPDSILLDIGLPGMDGYTLARRLRSEGFDRATLIAISGYGEAHARQESRAAGFDHHLVKPIDPDELLGLLPSDPSS